MFQDRTSSAQMGGITEEFIKKLSEKVNLLTMERKSQGKTVPEEQVMANIRQFKVKGSHPGLHPSLNSTSVPILALDININTNKIVTGRADKNAMVFNKETETKLQLKGHTKLVN